jgi:hypothetical protein
MEDRQGNKATRKQPLQRMKFDMVFTAKLCLLLAGLKFTDRGKVITEELCLLGCYALWLL